nr:hypothetical protein [Tanacetum cinerariifolium]
MKEMDVKSAFLYGEIKEEVYVCHPPGFEDPYFPDRVYKVEKALYGLHQAPKAWKELCTEFEKIMHKKFKISSMRELTSLLASTPMETNKPLLKDENGAEVDVHLYRLMIGSLMYLTSSRPDIMFAAKNINREAQIHTKVDEKKVIIYEATIRRDLKFEDEGGVDCLSNEVIFEQLTLIG